MSASQYFFQVQIDFLAYYGRPADPAGQLFWATKIDQAGGDNTAVINAFANSPESLALFGPITSANIAQVVTLFYLRDFNRVPDAAGLAFYVNGFNNHTFTPATIALNIFNGATGDDAVALGNKIHVANLISQEIAGRSYNDPHYGDNPADFTTTYSGNGDADHARDFMQNVHSDPGSVPSDFLIKLFLQNIIANPGDSILLDGQTFVLTPFVDAGPDFEGGAADNKYIASGTTLTAGDNLDGGGGDNSFFYQSGHPNGDNPVSHSGFMTKNIQNFFLTADVDTTLDMSGTKDVVWVTDTNSADNLTLNFGPEITKVLLQNPTVAHCLTVNYAAKTVEGNADTQVLWLDGALPGSKVKIDGIETMHVTTLNNDSSLWTIQSDSLKTFNLDGTKSLTLDHLDFPGAGTLTSANKGDLTMEKLDFGGAGTVDANNTGNLELDHVTFGVGSSSIDASGIGGAMFVELDNAASAGRKVAVTGSGQDDTLDVQNGFNSGDSANLGGGTDEMFIDPSNFSVDENAITNTEIADLLSGTLATFDLDAFDTALNRVEINTNTAGTVDFLNVENDGSEFFIFDNDVANLDGKTVNFHAVDTDPIFHSTESTVNLEIDNINEDTSVTFGGFEDNSATLNAALFGDSDATFFMHLDPVTTLGLSGNVNIDVTSDAPTVTTVNGGTTTGNVNIEAGVLSNSGATVTLGSGQDTVVGGNGNDSIDIGTGGGSVDAGSGNDTVVAHGNGDVTFNGGDGNDSLVGANGDDKLVGGNGADTIISGDGQNTLEGDGGADVLVGGADSDKLIGGLGSDTMTGGGGADVFHYDHVQESQGAFVDKITDFVSGTDKIDLLDALIAAAAPVTSMADVRFVGNVFGVAAALSALTGSGQVEIVYDTQNFMVYVDVNGDGTIDGTNDMVINMDPPATMQASDFNIPTGNVYTAAVNGFDTDNPADSFENTTTSSGPDIVNALGSQIPGSNIDGHGGGDTLNINTPLAAFDLGTVMDTQFINLNLNGTTGHVIGPDQTVSLHTFISSKGGDFETGTNLVGGISQTVDSGNGADTITLTNTNDSANTRGGNDVVHAVDGLTGKVFTGDGNDLVDVGGAFNGTVSTGAGTDEVEVRANAHFGTAAFLDGGSTALNNEGDELELFNGADVSGDTIVGFDHVRLGDSFFIFSSGNATMALSDYNALLGSDKVQAPGPNDTMTLIGAGSATLDSSVENWFGDFHQHVPQVFTLGSNDMNVTLYNDGTSFSADKIVNPFNRAHGTYTSNGGGSGDVFEQQVSADFQAGTDGVFSGFETLQLDNGADVTMTNSQHNSFNAIDGQNGPPFGSDTNVVDISNVFNGTTRDSVEVYNLNGNGATTYNVGGNNQTIFDNNTAGHTVNFNNNLNGVTLHTDGGADSISLGSGESNITITSDGGADTVNALFGGTNISITTDANDTVNLGGTHTGLSVNTGIDDDTVNMANSSTLSGNINVGTGTDTLNFGTGNYGGLTISGYHSGDNVNLTTVGTYTFNANTYNSVITANDGAPVLGGAGAVDATTVHVSDASASSTLGWVNFSNDNVQDYGKFGTLVMDSSGNDVVKFNEGNFANIQQLSIGAGGSDKVFIDNTSFQATKNDGYLQITGFTADDKLVLQEAGTAGGVDQLIVAANTALSVNNAGVVIVNNTAVPTGLLAPTDVSNNGAVESYLAGAIGNVGAIAGFFAVAYGTDGNAYVYAVNDTPSTDLTPGANMDVELVGVLNSVAANTLGFTNFAAS